MSATGFFRPALVGALLGLMLAGSTALAAPADKKSPEEQTDEKLQKATTRYNEGTDWMRRADSLMAKGDRKGATKQYESAIKRFTEAVDLNPNFPEAWNNLAYSLRLTGRYEEALKHYDRAIKLKPDFMQAHEYRARAYLALDRVKDAEAEHAFLVKAGYEKEAAELQKSIDAWVLAKAEGRKVGAEKNAGW
jgi:tetratricopeptide (TPR) repeat protein